MSHPTVCVVTTRVVKVVTTVTTGMVMMLVVSMDGEIYILDGVIHLSDFIAGTGLVVIDLRMMGVVPRVVAMVTSDMRVVLRFHFLI